MQGSKFMNDCKTEIMIISLKEAKFCSASHFALLLEAKWMEAWEESWIQRY